MGKRAPITLEEEAGYKISRQQLGRLLRTRRVSEGISQRAMAEQLKIDRRTLGLWEKGEVSVELIRLLNYILGDETSMANMWRRRALLAEAALKDVTEAIIEYRRGHRDHLSVRKDI